MSDAKPQGYEWDFEEGHVVPDTTAHQTPFTFQTIRP